MWFKRQKAIHRGTLSLAISMSATLLCATSAPALELPGEFGMPAGISKAVVDGNRLVGAQNEEHQSAKLFTIDIPSGAQTQFFELAPDQTLESFDAWNGHVGVVYYEDVTPKNGEIQKYKSTAMTMLDDGSDRRVVATAVYYEESVQRHCGTSLEYARPNPDGSVLLGDIDSGAPLRHNKYFFCAFEKPYVSWSRYRYRLARYVDGKLKHRVAMVLDYAPWEVGNYYDQTMSPDGLSFARHARRNWLFYDLVSGRVSIVPYSGRYDTRTVVLAGSRSMITVNRTCAARKCNYKQVLYPDVHNSRVFKTVDDHPPEGSLAIMCGAALLTLGAHQNTYKLNRLLGAGPEVFYPEFPTGFAYTTVGCSDSFVIFSGYNLAEKKNHYAVMPLPNN
jgi:hypothetical protein